jgi:hypothetical protein
MSSGSSGRKKNNKAGLAIGAGLIGAAIATELNKPAEERTWHGSIAGFVPYDFRRPTADSVRSKLWNPSGPFWSPSVFGVGWSPNLGRLAAQFGLVAREPGDSGEPGESGEED